MNTTGLVYGDALQAASIYNHGVMVNFLLDNGAAVDGNGGGGFYINALQAAVVRKHDDIVRLLLPYHGHRAWLLAQGLSPSPRPTVPTATSKTNRTTPVATVTTSIPSSTNVSPTTATGFTPSVFPSQMNNTASTTVFGSTTVVWAFWIYLGGVWALLCMIFLI